MYPQEPLQIKRGALDRVQAYTPMPGEPVYSTTTNQLFVGDGVTPGGILVGGGAGNYDFGSIQSPNDINLDFGLAIT